MKHLTHLPLLLASVAASTLVQSPARACGGFFCNNSNPVNQAAERIIFAQDGDKVTQIVEVAYQGDPAKFSWVLPVPGIPVPSVGSIQVFDRLQAATNPTYQLTPTGPCFAISGDGDAGADLDGGDGDGDGPSVTVLDAGSIGRFDYETISVDAADEDPADVAVAWLTENGYDVGPMGREVLGPYLANGLNLIAFKLQPGADTGAIRPISLQYTANSMAIPIRPTAVAANSDMPILVWVLGNDRAVPTNYRTLELNDVLIDWFNPSNTYNQVVIAAANEAGGKGFVTELAGPSAQYAGIIAPEWERDLLGQLGGESRRADLTWLTQTFASYDGFVEVVEDTLKLREGVTAAEFASCPDCYFYPGSYSELGFGGAPEDGKNRIPHTDPIFTSDVAEFAEAIETQVMKPIADAAALFTKLDYVTRFYTTMSADEMTLDPIFEFNPELAEVSNTHVAELMLSCEDDSWTMTLPSGQKVKGNGTTWPYALDNKKLPYNARVLQYSTSGAGEVIKDNTSTILSLTNGAAGEGSQSVPNKKRGGLCSAEPGAPQPGPWAWLIPSAVLGAWLSRRRRAA